MDARAQIGPAVLGVVAAATIVLVLQDAFEVMLLPRRVERRARFAAIYFRLVWRAWSALAALLERRRGREGMFSHFGALSMLGLFATWAVGLIVSFGVIEWVLQPEGAGTRSGLAGQLYMSGATFFTLGYGDVVPHTGAARAAAVAEAGVGLGFIAMVIGYLPLIHQFFSRREALVIQLDSRAGSPPTAAAMLVNHAGNLHELEDFLRAWEVWGAELLEGHLSYPMLAYYRSQHDDQSWLAALAAVTDCCALMLVGLQGAGSFQARMTFGMMRQVVVEMARSLRLRPSAYDGGDRLGPAAARRLEAVLADAGLGWQAAEGSLEALHALRATYEPLLDSLGRRLMLRLPGWLPDDSTADHWTRGHRGLIASRLVEALSRQPDDQGRQPAIWRRLRFRLR